MAHAKKIRGALLITTQPIVEIRRPKFRNSLRSPMKNLVAKFSCVALAMLLSAGAISAEPSRQETIDWLTQKLSGYTTTWTALGEDNQVFDYSIKRFTIKDGILSFERELSSSSVLGNSPTNKMNVNLSLDELAARCPIQLVKFPFRIDPPLYEVELSKSQSKGGCSIRFTDRELAERIAKAFEHLIKLSGGKNEPF
jgi:hypothetical protein